MSEQNEKEADVKRIGELEKELKDLIVKHKHPVSCSFCGAHQKERKNMIAGPLVYICNECVVLCVDMLRDWGNDIAAEIQNPFKKIIDGREHHLLYNLQQSKMMWIPVEPKPTDGGDNKTNEESEDGQGN